MKSVIRKYICFVLILLVAVSSFALSVSAAAGRTSIAFSKTNPKIGETVTVTVRFTTTNPMLGASGTLSYPSDIVQYVSGTGTSNPSKGTVLLVSTQQNVTSASFNVSFKVLKAGSATFSLSECLVSDVNKEEEVTGSSARIVALSGDEGVTSQGSSSSSSKKSSNADLKEITVAAGTLTPAFSKDVTEYKVTMPHDKTDGILSCKVAHSAARLVFGGERELKVGLNKRTITVIAEDGTKKIYTVVFNRLDENGNDTTAEETNTDIEVTYNGVKYFLTNEFADEVLPTGFSIGIFKYGEQEVSCIKDPSGKLTALCLIAEESEEKEFFLYDEQKGFSEFKYLELNGATYTVFECEDTAPDGYAKTTVEFDAFSVSAYAPTGEELKDYVVLKAVGPDGVVGFYRFDTQQKSLQRFPEFSLENSTQTSAVPVSSSQKLIVIILLLLAVELVIAIIVIIIILIVKSAKKKAAEKENEYEEEYDVQEDSAIPDLNEGVDGEWIKTPEEDSEE